MWFTVKIILANLAISCLVCQNVSGQRKCVEIILGNFCVKNSRNNAFICIVIISGIKYSLPHCCEWNRNSGTKGHSITTYAISGMCLITQTGTIDWSWLRYLQLANIYSLRTFTAIPNNFEELPSEEFPWFNFKYFLMITGVVSLARSCVSGISLLITTSLRFPIDCSNERPD